MRQGHLVQACESGDQNCSHSRLTPLFIVRDPELGYSAPLTAEQLVLAGNIVYVLLTNFTKASLLTLYVRVFRDVAFTTVRKICWFLWVCLVVAMLWGVFGGALLCSPVSKYWEPWVVGNCYYSPQVYWESTAALNIALDWAVFLVPIPMVAKLNLPKAQMIGLLLVFMLGGL
jgi:hypothetical protein